MEGSPTNRAWFPHRCRGLAAGLIVLAQATTSVAADVEKWHRFELVFSDAAASYSESDQDPNPFLDRRLTCAFTSPSGADTYTVQGFFNADNAGATAGSKFVCRFSPNQEGTWTYTASFREGADVAVSLSPTAGSERGLAEAKSGSFTVGPSTASLPDFRHGTRGWLRNDGGHLLRHAGSSARLWKVGLNVGEGFLGYAGFDNTDRACAFDPTKPSNVKTYANHLADWSPGDPNWSCGDGCLHADPSNAGREIIGAINYIASLGVNSKYMLLLNVPDGDTCDTYPYLDPSMSTESKKHFDVSKLDQWEIVFEHMMHRGLMLHAQLGEVEIQTELDGNELSCSGPPGTCIGLHRKLYYREMVARFAHNVAVLWNIGEENGYSADARRDFLGYLHAINPYDQPTASHTKNKDGSSDTDVEDHYIPLLGNGDLDATSIQMSSTGGTWTGIRNEVLRWRADSAAAGEPWVTAIDEVPRNAAYNDPLEMEHARKNFQWQTLMAGGNWEWYLMVDDTVPPHVGWSEHGLDPWIDDFHLVEQELRWSGIARDILAQVPSLERLEPVATNTVIDSTGSADTWALADPGVAYLGYDRAGGSFTFDGAPGTYTVEFVAPDSGAACVGTPSVVVGGSPQSLGSCPCCDDDAAVLLVAEGIGPTTSSTTTTTTLPGPSACTPAAEPTCLESDKAKIDFNERKVGKEKLKLQWRRLAALTLQEEFGDPVDGDTSVAVCIYDDAGLLAEELSIERASRLCAGKPCWKARGLSGYSYKDKQRSADGVSKLTYKAGAAGKGKAGVKGANKASKGQTSLPTGLPVRLAGNTAPTIQMRTTDGFCITATMNRVKRDDDARYTAQRD
jgi:hypothetical protein